MNDQSHAPTHLRTIDELANHCFGCSPANPQGLHLQFDIVAEDSGPITASALVELTHMHEGAPGHIHGGILATLLDEAMSKLNRPLRLLAMTRHLEVDYLRPAPLHTTLTLTSRHLRRDGRKLFHTAELADAEGKILTRAKGLFVVIDPSLLSRGQVGR